MPIPMQVTPGTLPQGFCPPSEQARLNAFAAALGITFPLSLGNFSYGNSVPISDMQGFPWYRLNSDGSPDGWYTYFNGSWVRPNPVPANDPACLRFFTGPYASIATYDGGDTNPLGDASGPMWMVAGQTTGGATDYGTLGGRLPIGISADFGEGSSGGSQQQILTLTQIPKHVHPPLAPQTDFWGQGGGTSGLGGGGTSSQPTTGSTGGNPDGSTAPISIMNPYLAGYWISRTGRLYYSV